MPNPCWWKKNVGLVWSIVRRFQNRGYEAEDIFQIGCIGLIKAINKFDCSYDVKFSTYAVPMIIGEIKRFIRDDGMIKVSRSLKELANKARITKEIMSKGIGAGAGLSVKFRSSSAFPLKKWLWQWRQVVLLNPYTVHWERETIPPPFLLIKLQMKAKTRKWTL